MATTPTYYGTPNIGQTEATAAIGGTLIAPTFAGGSAGGELIIAGANGTKLNKIIVVPASTATAGSSGSGVIYVWIQIGSGVYILMDMIPLLASAWDTVTGSPGTVVRNYEKIVIPSGSGIWVGQSTAMTNHITGFAGNA